MAIEMQLSDFQTGDLEIEHPVISKEYAIFTPPMDPMIQCVGDWIDQRVTGGYIFGPPRFGKSRTVKWFLKNELETRFRVSLPMIVWIRRDTRMTETEFWNEILIAAKYEFADAAKQKRKSVGRYLLKEHLITLARSSRRNYVVLLIDEAQRMTLDEWMWILGLQNDLDYSGIRLTVISVGTHQIGYVPDFFAVTGNAHVSARFFSYDMPFRGLSSIDELRYVLNGYDVDSEWPDQSGVSFLQYFAEEYFRQGLRLADCAERIWNAFEALRPKEQKSNKKLKHFELPMQHVANTVESMLKSFASGKDWNTVTGQINVLDIVAKTGFTKFLTRVSYFSSEPKDEPT